LPTTYSRGPWDPAALHGGPVAALIAREIERVDAPLPMHTARITVELLRPVPLQPLRLTATVTRPGKKVQAVSVSVTVDDGGGAGLEVARASAQRIRLDPTVRADDGVAPGAVDPARNAPPPFLDGAPVPEFFTAHGYDAFHSHGVEHRIVTGGFTVPGPTTDWMRLAVPVVPEETPTPLQRVAAVADFGNGIGGVLDFERFTFVNPDLTIALSRLPEGEWICLDAITRLGDDGVALAESALSDRRGRIGRAIQTLLIDRRS
jgi:hypothetical protein